MLMRTGVLHSSQPITTTRLEPSAREIVDCEGSHRRASERSSKWRTALCINS
jgi:hypothetical protein